MKIATWNVNGVRARGAQLLEWIAAESPDVLCLQEIKATPEQVPPELLDLDGYWSYWHGGAGGYSGVALLMRKSCFASVPEFSIPAFDMENRIVQARVGDRVFVSVYIPNGGKDYDAKIAFLTAMQGYVASARDTGLAMVLCGDMNVALTDRDIHPSQNKPDIIGTRPQERALMAGMIGGGLVDIARRLDPDNDRLFTWWPPWKVARQRNLGWRIDYIFAADALALQAQSCVVHRAFGTSDHAPVVATLAIQAP